MAWKNMFDEQEDRTQKYPVISFEIGQFIVLSVISVKQMERYMCNVGIVGMWKKRAALSNIDACLGWFM